MTSKAYLSPEATALLKSLEAETSEPPTPSTVAAHRQASKAAFLPRAARARTRHDVTVQTVEIAGQTCLDIAPKGQINGTVLYCFGGGYVAGSAEEDLIVSAALSAQAGARVVSIEYPLAPEHPWPAAHEAAWSVFEAMQKDDPKLAIAGESAGGNLALTLMLRASYAPSAVLLLSPWCDLTHGGEAMQLNDGRDPTLSYAHCLEASGMYAAQADPSRPEISPINGEFSREGPSVMITTGTRDLLFSQCAELARRMRMAGQDVRLDVYDGLWHVFEFYDELPEARLSLQECGAFLKRHLR
ncbi:MAG: alpha/beta hydrolase [Pseudomonadota bacterium]